MDKNGGFSALVFGASGGVGAALAAHLRADASYETVIGLSRREDGVDLLDEASLAAAAKTLEGSAFDLIVNAAGALDIMGDGPEKAFRDIDPAHMTRAFEINAVGGALFFKHFLPLLKPKGRAAALSARVGSIGDNELGGWVSYRASKAALNQIVRCAAIETGRRNRDSIVVALHPGTIDTPMTRAYAKGRFTATADECAANLLRVIGGLAPTDTGGFFDYAGKHVAW